MTAEVRKPHDTDGPIVLYASVVYWHIMLAQIPCPSASQLPFSHRTVACKDIGFRNNICRQSTQGPVD